MNNPFERRPVRENNIAKPEIRRASRAESKKLQTGEAVELSPRWVPPEVGAEFERLKGMLEGPLTDERIAFEDLPDGTRRFTLWGKLRTDETRAASSATFLVNMTPEGFYTGIILSVDEKEGRVVATDIARQHDTLFSGRL